MKRREFIKTSALASTAWLTPTFLQSAAARGWLSMNDTNGKKLIIIQLSGGNDGLNTIVPYRNDWYYKLRPKLALSKDDILPLNDELAIHCAMGGLRGLYDQGLLSIINNVGYPNPDLSHFRSMDIWHSATDSDKYLSTGWIGRYLDHSCTGCAKPYSAIELDDTLSLALRGESVKGLAIHNPGLFYQLSRDLHIPTTHATGNESLDYLYKTMTETQQSAEYLQSKSKGYKTTINYPDEGFSNNLKTIASLIASGVETSVYYASISGFDTHVNQAYQQEQNLSKVSGALESLVADLKQSGHLDETLIMVFSEFGRRVQQNASNGTDHGKANNLFIISSQLKKQGIYNAPPNLEHLDEGDVAHTVDFRAVYDMVLSRWLGADAGQILGRRFEGVGVI